MSGSRRWQIGEKIGAGGNAEVLRVTEAGGSQCFAMKRLTRKWQAGGEPCERFEHEILTRDSLRGLPGVMPLVDFHIPRGERAAGHPFYVMPLMTPSKSAAAGMAVEQVVAGIASVAGTLARLYDERGISHRDVKPENLFVGDGQWVIGDFGLVSNPELSALTTEGKKLGPVHYIAPEMLNSPNESNGSLADVYGLAKTLWVLLTDYGYPLPGPHSLAEEHQTRTYGLASYASFDRTRLRSLDWLLVYATDIIPSRRPAMRSLSEGLTAWLQPPVTEEGGRMDIRDIARQLVEETRDEVARAASEQERGARLASADSATSAKLQSLNTQLRRELPGFEVSAVMTGGTEAPQEFRPSPSRPVAQTYFFLYPPGHSRLQVHYAITRTLRDSRELTFEAWLALATLRKDQPLSDWELIWTGREQCLCSTPQQEVALGSLVKGLGDNAARSLALLLKRVREERQVSE